MTNQNVVLSDEQAAIEIAIKVAALSNSLLLENQNPSLPPKKKIRSSISETASRGRTITNSWLESMRDSSPTRLDSTIPSLTEIEDKQSWMVNHPSALHMFDDIVNLSKGKQIVMFLDYDGTLSPIVEDPDQAFMTTEMREAVKAVAKQFPTAIVTGRCRDKVYNFVKLAELYYAGSHGMDIKGPSKSCKYQKFQSAQSVLFQPASKFLPMIDKVYKVLLDRTRSISGVKVENNKFCVSVHFRCVQEEMWATLVETVTSVLNCYPKLRLSQGRKVLEIRPIIKWDKGKALEFLLESLGYENSSDVLPVYIGDDRTDEDAFNILRSRGQGFGILVSKVPKETNATYSLQETTEVEEFLRRLVGWKKSSIG